MGVSASPEAIIPLAMTESAANLNTLDPVVATGLLATTGATAFNSSFNLLRRFFNFITAFAE